ncbi:uncharacterized protein LOC131241982 [Magnolia sinica]|uniref:uncharacterized protein LOC131241982 n=1 Tax=Magnolia sinica TaxID=86752 RepID=UPI002658B64E|nr:uncharacterized protein LOC131241982 [Magnolia sinica]
MLWSAKDVKWVPLNASGSSGGIILAWKTSKWELQSSSVGSFSISAILKDKCSSLCCLVSSVYGPNSDNIRKDFWNELTSIRHSFPGPCCFVGDFNVIRFAEEHSRKRRVSSAMEEFSDWIQSHELVDLPLFGARFTWSNGRQTPIQSRLDRFLLSTDWLEAFPAASQLALPRITSDHCPILLSLEDESWGPKPFRFNSSRINLKDFKQRLKEWWSSFQVEGFAGHKLLCKLKLLKEKLKKWKIEELGKKDSEMAALLSELQRLDSEAEGSMLSSEALGRCIQIIQDISIRSLQDEIS